MLSRIAPRARGGGFRGIWTRCCGSSFRSPGIDGPIRRCISWWRLRTCCGAGLRRLPMAGGSLIALGPVGAYGRRRPIHHSNTTRGRNELALPSRLRMTASGRLLTRRPGHLHLHLLLTVASLLRARSRWRQCHHNRLHSRVLASVGKRRIIAKFVGPISIR